MTIENEAMKAAVAMVTAVRAGEAVASADVAVDVARDPRLAIATLGAVVGLLRGTLALLDEHGYDSDSLLRAMGTAAARR